MKNNIKVILSGILVGMISFFLFYLCGCTTDAKEKSKPQKEVVAAKEVKDAKEKKHSCCSGEMDKDEYSENSIYQLESKWIDQSGNKIELSKFQGKPVVLTMFFASCTYACPLLVNDMKKIESHLTKEELKNYQFVLVSIDPDKDTPQKLYQYAGDHNLDLSRWTLLSGTKNNIQELAAVLGFKYKKEKNGEYSHSNLINVLNTNGEVAYQQTGLNQDVTIITGKLTEQNKF